MNVNQLSVLKKQGFDQSYWDHETSHYHVSCSQCEVMIIQQIATHEIGCPNANYDYDTDDDSHPGHPNHYGSK